MPRNHQQHEIQRAITARSLGEHDEADRIIAGLADDPTGAALMALMVAADANMRFLADVDGEPDDVTVHLSHNGRSRRYVRTAVRDVRRYTTVLYRHLEGDTRILRRLQRRRHAQSVTRGAVIVVGGYVAAMSQAWWVDVVAAGGDLHANYSRGQGQ